MSDDEVEDGPPPAVEDSNLDSEGYHIVSNRGRFAETLNPLQLKLMEEKRKAEARAAEEAKKAKLAAKLAAFGGGVASKATVDVAAGAGERKKTGVPEVSKGPIDGKFKEMMNSGIVNKKVKGVAALQSKGRRVIGKSSASPIGTTDSPRAAECITPLATGSSGSKAGDDSDDSTDSEVERTRRKAALEACAAKKAALTPTATIVTASSPTGARVTSSTGAALSTPSSTGTGDAPRDASKRRATMVVAALHQKRESMAPAAFASAHAGSHSLATHTHHGTTLPPPPPLPAVAPSVAHIERSARKSQGLALAAAVLAALHEEDERLEQEAALEAQTAANTAAAAATSTHTSLSLKDHIKRTPTVNEYSRVSIVTRNAERWSDDEGDETHKHGASAPKHVQPLASLSYKALVRSLRTLAAGGSIDTAYPERYLQPGEMARVFEVDGPEAFAAMPKWRQVALRKKTSLFIAAPALKSK